MPQSHLSFAALPTEDWQRLQDQLHDFEAALKAGRHPDIRAFLEGTQNHRATLLAELIHLELEYRRRAGADVHLESYLEQYPELSPHVNLIHDLIRADFELLRKQTPQLTLAEFAGRFAGYDVVGLMSTANERPGAVTADSQATLPPSTDAIRQPGRTSSARFTLLREHAHGGLGKVSVAHDADLDRLVAFKEIRADRDSEYTRQRFLNEAAITGQLEHPGIVPIYAAGADDAGKPYYAMRFIEGKTLGEALGEFHKTQPRDFQSLPFRALLQRFTAVCQTMAFAHSKGIIHRDLKPANIMLGEYGETLVVDWGLAKRQQDQAEPPGGASLPERKSATGLTQVGQVLGTPAYMSPEQAAGAVATLGPATDIYALGAILYELLTGTHPYSGKNAAEIFAALQAAPPTLPTQQLPSVPRPLETICLKALSRDPADRYATATDLSQDVERWLADERVSAHTESLLPRAGRWMRKHRILVRSGLATCAIAIPALAIGLFVVNYFRESEKDAKEIALSARDRGRETIEAMLTEETLDALSRQQELTGQQKKFLRNMVKYYEELSTEAPADEEGQIKVLRALMLMGRAQMLLGEKQSADDVYRKAIAQGRRLADEFPDERKHRDGLASIYNHHYLILSALTRFQEAETALRECLAIQEKLAGEFPSDPECREDLNVSYSNLGLLLKEVGRFDEAQTALGQSIAIGEKLVAEFPKVPSYRQKLGRSHLNLGLVMEVLNKHEEALSRYQMGSVHMKALVREFPDKVEYQEEYAKCLNNLGVGFHHLDRYPEAKDAYQQAVTAYAKLTTDFPALPDFRRSQANSHKNLGTVLLNLGDVTQAEAELRAAIAILEKLHADAPSESLNQLYLARSCTNLGSVLDKLKRHEEAEQVHQRSIAISVKFPDLPGYHEVELQAYGGLAEHFAALKKKDEAHAVYRQALTILERRALRFADDPKHRRDLANGYRGLAGLLKQMDADPDPTYRQAIVIFEKLVADNPADHKYRDDLAGAHNDAAVALSDRGKHNQALVDLDRARVLVDRLVRDQPDSADHYRFLGAIHTNRSRALAATRRYGESLEAITQAGLAQTMAVRVGGKPRVPSATKSPQELKEPAPQDRSPPR